MLLWEDLPGILTNEEMLPRFPEDTAFFPPSTSLSESGLWVRPGASRTSNNRRSSGHVGSLDQKAGQGASQLFFLNCRGGNAPLSTVESQIQPCVLLEVTNVPISFTRCAQSLVAYLF